MILIGTYLMFMVCQFLGAVRKNMSTSNATNTEIDSSIRNWIKNAPDRAGGRANRRKKKIFF